MFPIWTGATLTALMIGMAKGLAVTVVLVFVYMMVTQVLAKVAERFPKLPKGDGRRGPTHSAGNLT